MSATVDFPAPIPPVSPASSTVGHCRENVLRSAPQRADNWRVKRGRALLDDDDGRGPGEKAAGTPTAAATSPRPDAVVRGTIVDNQPEPAPTALEEASVAPIRIPGRHDGRPARSAQAAIGEHLGPLLIILRWSTVGRRPPAPRPATRDVGDPGNIVAAVLLTLYTAFRTVRPLQLRDTDRGAEIAVFAELALCVVALSISGLWQSPFVLVPIPAVMLAGFGWGYREGIAAAAIAAGTLTLADVLVGDGTTRRRRRRAGRAHARPLRVHRRVHRASSGSPRRHGAAATGTSTHAWRPPTTS